MGGVFVAPQPVYQVKLIIKLQVGSCAPVAGDPRGTAQPHLGAPRLRSSPVPVTKAQLGRVRACWCCLSNFKRSHFV